MVLIRDIDSTQVTLSVKNNKFTGKPDIFVNPSKTKKVPLRGQLGDDGMENPIRPLKAASSYENSDPEKPSVFTCIDDKATEEFFRGIDKVLPQEMERLGLAGPKQYPPDQYRPIWVEPAEEGQTGAISIKMNLAGDNPCDITKLVDDGEGGLDQVEATANDIKPGAVQAMYYKISFSKIWKVKKEWGVTIWANQIVLRTGEDDDDMVLPGTKPKTTPAVVEPTEEETEAHSEEAVVDESNETENVEDALAAEDAPAAEDADDSSDKPKKRRRDKDGKKSKRSRKDDSDEE